MATTTNNTYKRKPSWLKIQLPKGETFTIVNETIKKHKLHTICTSGNCPNQGECWAAGTATFMILGDICTRSCKFCATKSGKPLPVNTTEPEEVAQSVKSLKLRHCVLTSVDRDDLDDFGAEMWAKTIRAIKKENPQTTIEGLIPDFNGNKDLIAKVIASTPELLSHNLETVERLTPQVRSRAKYKLSLEVIKQISASGIRSKSGIMLGLGESEQEILQTMDDLLDVGCEVFTLGQYLQPSKQHLSVKEYVKPEKFEEYREIGLKKGFRFVESGPLVRSSYHASKHVK
ncbi:MAG: lipoyl synthase [Bacteroidia bacterium]|nr:MAG: lipoyl synthase [Bacteroidia bacterium]